MFIILMNRHERHSNFEYERIENRVSTGDSPIETFNFYRPKTKAEISHNTNQKRHTSIIYLLLLVVVNGDGDGLAHHCIILWRCDAIKTRLDPTRRDNFFNIYFGNAFKIDPFFPVTALSRFGSVSFKLLMPNNEEWTAHICTESALSTEFKSHQIFSYLYLNTHLPNQQPAIH